MACGIIFAITVGFLAVAVFSQAPPSVPVVIPSKQPIKTEPPKPPERVLDTSIPKWAKEELAKHKTFSSQSTSELSGTIAVSQPLSRQIPGHVSPGEIGYLRIDSSDSVAYAGVTSDFYDQFMNAARAKNSVEMATLLIAGKAFSLRPDTVVTVITSGFSLSQVRVMEGKNQGETGWLPPQFIHTAPGGEPNQTTQQERKPVAPSPTEIEKQRGENRKSSIRTLCFGGNSPPWGSLHLNSFDQNLQATARCHCSRQASVVWFFNTAAL